MTEPKFRPGQTVILTDVNRRGSEDVLISRVGRKLVYVEKHGRMIAFRIDTGFINDQYGHSRIRTLEEYEADQETVALHNRFMETGFRLEGPTSKLTNDQLSRILDILEEPPLTS